MQPILSPAKILDPLILMQIVHNGPSHGYALSIDIEERFGWNSVHSPSFNSKLVDEDISLQSLRDL